MIRHSHRRISSLLAVICFAILILQLFPRTVSAGTIPVTVRIPVSCEGYNTSENFTFVLDMDSTEYQSADRLMLRLGAGENSAFSVQYVYPGTYHYRIYQEAGTDTRTSYDSSVYEIDVYVTEDEEGGLQGEPVAYIKGSDEKKASVSFTNTRQVPSSNRVSPVKTGDNTELVKLLLILGMSTAVLLVVLIRQIKQRKGE